MSQKSDTGRSKLYGMTEYLMIAHEMEKARLLGRKARKNLRRSPRSPTRHRREHGVSEQCYEDGSARLRDGPDLYQWRTARSSPRPSTTRLRSNRNERNDR